MRTLLTFCIWLFCLTMSGQIPSALVLGHTDTIHSQILQEDRTLWIYNPSDDSTPHGECFPVLFLLDGELHYASTVAMIRQMQGHWPGILVVGILNTDRNRDLTPDRNPMEGSDHGPGSNDNKFIQFVKSELIPYVEATYPASSYRIISGHSLGGLTAIYTLLNDPGLFRSYIAIDPSLWWKNGKLIAQARQELQTRNYKGISLFLGRANNMPPGMDTIAALADTTQFTSIYRNVTRFKGNLEKAPQNGLCWKSKFYPEETHGTVQLNAQYDALKFLFNFYQFRTSLFELHPEMDMDSTLTAHFEMVSRRFGYPAHPSESLINNLGYTCLSLKKWDQAKALLMQNIRNHPQSANCYDSMGDYYQATGNRQQAIAQYAKALTLGDDPETRQKLDYLKSLQ